MTQVEAGFVDTRNFGRLELTTLLPGSEKGGQGRGFETNVPPYLIKIWDPDDPHDVATERVEAEWRYRTFAALDFGSEPPLRSLPLEYVAVGGDPAYVMELARGVDVGQSLPNLQLIDLASRMMIALGLAEGVSRLHSRRVVHADIKPDNVVVDPVTMAVRVLDVDSGGYCGFETGTPREEPDLWALAMVLYDVLVVDPDGAWPSSSFGPYDYLGRGAEWPSLGQEHLLATQGIPTLIMDLFRQVFGRQRNHLRPTAEHWLMALEFWMERSRATALTGVAPAPHDAAAQAPQGAPPAKALTGRTHTSRSWSVLALTSGVLAFASWAAVLYSAAAILLAIAAFVIALMARPQIKRFRQRGSSEMRLGLVLAVAQIVTEIWIHAHA